jgi:CPA1 family monovalent cation:H+ antiporter
MKKLEECGDRESSEVYAAIRQRVEQRNFAAWERLGTAADRETPSDAYARVRVIMLEAERQRVLEVRDTGHVPSEIVTEVLAMLDVEESMLDYGLQQRAETRGRTVSMRRGPTCDDLDAFPVVQTADDPVCQTCLDEGLRWVALRQCLECGQVGCCDSSPGRHATAHFHQTQHPVMETAEAGEDWRWCYVHHLTA